jgi:hypothetical protein
MTFSGTAAIDLGKSLCRARLTIDGTRTHREGGERPDSPRATASPSPASILPLLADARRGSASARPERCTRPPRPRRSPRARG